MMSKFRKGDFIVHNRNLVVALVAHGVTIGNFYEVVEVYIGDDGKVSTYVFKNDYGEYAYFFPHFIEKCFINLKEYRNNTINNILI